MEILEYQEILEYLQITNKQLEIPITVVEDCADFSQDLAGVYVYFENEDKFNIMDKIVALGTIEATHCSQLIEQAPVEAYKILLKRSGPLVLTASTCLGKYQKELEAGELKLFLDLKASLTPEQLDKRFLREFDTYRNKNISNVMERLLPKKMIPVFLDMAQIPEDKKIRDISKKERRRMIELMKNFEMHISGVRGFNEAIVTRGGVNVKEINPATMESKKVKHLFFAGEIMDLDAVTGGYNLQIAWTTGYAAGKNA